MLSSLMTVTHRNAARAATGVGPKTLLAIALLVNLVVVLYGPVLVDLVRQWWNDEDYSHGFVVPLVSGYLVWQRRRFLANLLPAPSGAGLVLIVGGVGLFMLGNLGAELFTTRVSLLVVGSGLILYLLGRDHLKEVSFPLGYLLFMIPLPALVLNAITFPLQLVAARTATASLQLAGIPVFREGNLITLANATLEVAEACSGIRSLITLLALATTVAYFTQSGIWRRALLIASAVPIAILTNASRVAGTGALAHFFGEAVAQGFFHTFSGWLVFLGGVVLLFAATACLGGLAAREAVGTAPDARRVSP